ncbi:right-handed parallel beta-helix repeat-containing protein [Halocatena halophila]|uniref:right-handed parallel beta-helix repeat-containing protein n=1 Tax=Halocatena halophila TaxID=2814576 RepID=UPI002ED24B77
MADSDSHTENERSGLTRRTALELFALAGGTPLLASRTTAGESTSQKSGGVRPWNQDVDAQHHRLANLGSIDVEHVHTPARATDVVVWKDADGVFHADGRDEHVTSGSDVLSVTQAAVDSLTPDRTWMETVSIVSPGRVPYTDGPFRSIELPSYTRLDGAAPISCEFEDGDHSNVIVATATDAEHVEIPRLTVTGGPWMALRIQRCSNVRLGELTVLYDPGADTNDGIRIDNGYDIGTPRRCTDVQLSSVYLEHGGHHAVETYGVDRLQIGDVLAKEIGGCAVLLNQTTDATVNSVIGRNPGGPAGYPTFRLANFCNNVSVRQIVSRGGMKGVMLLTARNTSIGDVNIVGAEDSGIFVSTSFNVVINGGVIKNCNGEAIRIHGYPTDQFEYTLPTANITVANVRLLDDRSGSDRTQTYAIRETGPTAFSNQYVHNDVRAGGTVTPIAVGSPSSVITDNVGDGEARGTVTLTPNTDLPARVPGVSPHRGVTLKLREAVTEGPNAAFAWDAYFEWDPTAERWDLVFEWRTDPGEPLTVAYIVDRPQATLDTREFEDNWDEFARMEG